MMYIQGTLCVNNLRDVATMYPKVLIKDTNTHKGHSWLKINKELEKLIQRARRSKIRVKLLVKPYKYGLDNKEGYSVKKVLQWG